MAYQATQDVIDCIIENAKLSDEDILGMLIPLKVPFNSAKGVLKKVLEENGLRMSKEQRDTKAKELLADFEPTEETEIDEVNEIIENLVEELGCTAGVARAYVRTLFTAVEIAMPKNSSGGGGKRGPRTPGMKGDAKLSADFAIENPEAVENDLEAFKAYMDANGGSTTRAGKDKSTRWYSAVVDFRIFGKAWQEKHCND